LFADHPKTIIVKTNDPSDRYHVVTRNGDIKTYLPEFFANPPCPIDVACTTDSVGEIGNTTIFPCDIADNPKQRGVNLESEAWKNTVKRLGTNLTLLQAMGESSQSSVFTKEFEKIASVLKAAWKIGWPERYMGPSEELDELQQASNVLRTNIQCPSKSQDPFVQPFDTIAVCKSQQVPFVNFAGPKSHCPAKPSVVSLGPNVEVLNVTKG